MSRLWFPGKHRRSQKKPPPPSPEEYLWSAVPDVLGRIEGARVWRLSKDETRLLSVVRDVTWEPGEVLETRCLPNGPGGKQTGLFFAESCKKPPQPMCHCGIWGIYDWTLCEHRTSWAPGATRFTTKLVGGAIAAFGHVVEGNVGFRAQFAQPTLLSYQGFEWPKSRRTIIEKLSETYAIPIVKRMPTFKKPE